MKKLLTLLLFLILLMQTMVITLAEEAYKVEIDSEGFLLDNMENEEQNLEVVIDANEECLIDAMNTISLDNVIMPEVEPIELDSIESFDANVFESTEPDLTMENASNVAIDREHFPDKIFRNYISMNYDIDQDGSLSEKERKEVTKLAIYNMGIT